MFRQLSTFILGIVVGGALVFFGQRYHVLRTDRGLETVPKLSSGFNDTYVDVRQFQAADWEPIRSWRPRSYTPSARICGRLGERSNPSGRRPIRRSVEEPGSS